MGIFYINSGLKICMRTAHIDSELQVNIMFELSSILDLRLECIRWFMSKVQWKQTTIKPRNTNNMWLVTKPHAANSNMEKNRLPDLTTQIEQREWMLRIHIWNEVFAAYLPSLNLWIRAKRSRNELWPIFKAKSKEIQVKITLNFQILT